MVSPVLQYCYKHHTGGEKDQVNLAARMKKYDWAYLLLALMGFLFALLYSSYYIRWGVYGRVLDKTTGKPIPYALVSLGISWSYDKHLVMGNIRCGTYHTVTDAKGFYRFPWGLERRWDFRPTYHGFVYVDGEGLCVWYPGYHKYEAYTEGEKFFKGKTDIYLERPKTTLGPWIACEYGCAFLPEQLNTNREVYCKSCAYWDVVESKCYGEFIKNDPHSQTSYQMMSDHPYVAKFIDCNLLLNEDLKNVCLELQRNIEEDLFNYLHNKCSEGKLVETKQKDYAPFLKFIEKGFKY